jgi:hypothetical protein
VLHAQQGFRALAAFHLVEAFVLIASVPEGSNSVDVKGVFTLADASGALLYHRLVQHTLVHL